MGNQLLERQIEEEKTKKHAPGLLSVAMGLVVISLLLGGLLAKNDPYTQKVLSFQGNVARGEAIFRVNCAGCHGLNGGGNVGPSLQGISKHKSDSQLIQQVISGKTPPMPKFQPSAEDMADLLSYLRTL
ncbi:MAG: cytochrome c [Geminocystis sp.]|nr:cytochrome c [Geminocystis sp.]MCS7146715.1 cytochrome c [Geminocystis sp.]MCX8077135.1 cytochrome c [Geminocystis sp.]MDW8115541.1 cytochrome c [Geminocystis sp.]MDW8463082.1 cytochrome c [Geminocystis sp.]